MIEATLRVNGALIGQLYARNITEFGLGDNPDAIPNKYLVEYYEPESGVVGRMVTHNRPDGAAKLMALAFSAIVEKKKRIEKKKVQCAR